MKLGSNGAAGFPVVDDGPEHNAEDEYPDGHADPEDQHVQVVDFPADSRHARSHVQIKFGGSGYAPTE
jgi:hypothetical protein